MSWMTYATIMITNCEVNLKVKTVDEYISELHKGNKIRIIHNRRNEDHQGGWWQEEL